MTGERGFRWAALAWCALGFAFLAVAPSAPIEGFGNHRLPAVVHAFTLGVFVNGVYALQWRAWRRLYRRDPPWPWVTGLIWACHQAGVLLMLAGFLFAGLRVAAWGAHDLVPAGIVLHVLQGAWAARRREPGTPRHLGAHAAELGLLVVMCLGVMILLDELTGAYGLFTPPTLLLHACAGAFLILFPALWLAEGLAGVDAPDVRGEAAVTAGLLLRAVPLAVGVLFLATGLAPGGGTIALPAGLALLGAGVTWRALPGAGWKPTDAAQLARAAWLIPGLILLFTAIRALRGMQAPEAFQWADYGVAGVLWIAGVPEVVTRLLARDAPARRLLPGTAMLIVAGAVIVAGQIAISEGTVQAAAGLGLAGLLLMLTVPRLGQRPARSSL